MFNSIAGIITAKLPSIVYIETQGIEWDISIPDTTLDALPHVGEQGRIFVWLYHREDAMKLYGFSSVEERSVFIDLMKVDGIGPRGALKILSKISARLLAEILDSEDMSKLEKLPGVGKKTAQKMLLTLKGKLAFSSDNEAKKEKNVLWLDVVTALVSMGFDKKLAEDVIEKIDASLDKELIGQERESALFKQAIIALST